jgi:DNA-binding transcriptional ArsR family regulator
MNLDKDMQALAENAAKATALLKVLANENRLMICCGLGEDELSVGQLNQGLPLSQSALSQHLARMREVGILRTRKEAQTVFYSVADPAVGHVINTLKTIYCP